MAIADPLNAEKPLIAPPKTGLAANNIGKAYRGRVVVKNITLTVQRGEVVALMGPNGAGKTTSFYMIMGLIEADRGMITLDGQDITKLPMYQRARLGVSCSPVYLGNGTATILMIPYVRPYIRQTCYPADPGERGEERVARLSLGRKSVNLTFASF